MVSGFPTRLQSELFFIAESTARDLLHMSCLKKETEVSLLPKSRAVRRGSRPAERPGRKCG